MACPWLPWKLCESNIGLLYRYASEVVPSKQLTHYLAGVGFSEDVEDNIKTGTKTRMMNTYVWLVQQYQPCDEIFIFGASRGALAARMLQGMIHRVGLAVPEHVGKAVHVHFTGGTAAAAAFKASAESRPGVKVKFAGFFDAVLRTLLHPERTEQIAAYSLELTSSLESLAHAISLDSIQELYDSHELYTDPATAAKQVWFMGVHGDVGGGLPNSGVARIAAGWVADEAVKAGFSLPADWHMREDMKINFYDNVFTRTGLGNLKGGEMQCAVSFSQGHLSVRDPSKCHAEFGKAGQRILVHQSVRDRMVENHGWVPLLHCCEKVRKNIDKIGREYVTNEHYATVKASYTAAGPYWLRLSFGRLKNAKLSKYSFDRPEFMLKIGSWNARSCMPPHPERSVAYGCSTFVTLQARHIQANVTDLGDAAAPNRRASADLRQLSTVIPYAAAAYDEVLIEVHEADYFSGSALIGRAEVSYRDAGSFLELSLGDGMSIEVNIEAIYHDTVVAKQLDKKDPAVCSWLETFTGMSRAGKHYRSLCAASELMATRNCKYFWNQITTGM